MKLTLDSTVLEALLERATTAGRLVGCVDARAASAIVEPLADAIDEMVHVLSELLGNPEIVTSVPHACASFAVAPDDDVDGGGENGIVLRGAP